MTKLTEPARASSDAVPDTHDMVVIHRIFRRGFPELASLVRGVSPGDRARAESITPHVEFFLNGLHHHHAAEDGLLWPRLLERAPAEARELIERMPAEHQQVDLLVSEIRQRMPAWRTDTSGDELARAIDELDRVLVEHLDVEEAELLPLVEAHVTEAEWAQLGEEAFEPFTNEEKLIATGQLLEVATPDEAAMFMGRLPVPIRVMWKLAGQRKYRKYVRGVRGER